ncbi:MAG: DUF4153 domain-containing protein, partial [Bacteroidota bacterium]
MRRSIIPFTLLAAFTLLFDLMFWQEELGLNLVLFHVLIGVAAVVVHRPSWSGVPLRVVTAGTLLCGAMVLFNGSGTARVAFCLSFMAFLGLVLQPAIRSLPAALSTGMANLGTGIFAAFFQLPKFKLKGKKRKTSPMAYLAMSIIPLVAALIFFGLFAGANPKFGALADNLMEAVDQFLLNLFGEISLPRVMFIIFGGLLACGVLFSLPVRMFRIWEKDSDERLDRGKLRARRRKKLKLAPTRIRGIQEEYRVALMLVALVNVLALVNNVIDISWIWFGFEFDPGFNLSQFVHEGTWLLVASILLSMAIMFYFFRGNQNFYR